jgi:hypothetical protein
VPEVVRRDPLDTGPLHGAGDPLAFLATIRDIREDGEERLSVALGQMACCVIAAVNQISRVTGEQLDTGAIVQRWLMNALDAEAQLALDRALDKDDPDPTLDA